MFCGLTPAGGSTMCMCVCVIVDAVSNPAVEVEEQEQEPATSVDDVTAAVPAITFVSSYDNDNDNDKLVHQTPTAADDDDDDEEDDGRDVNEEMPLVAAESVCTAPLFSTCCSTVVFSRC